MQNPPRSYYDINKSIKSTNNAQWKDKDKIYTASQIIKILTTIMKLTIGLAMPIDLDG